MFRGLWPDYRIWGLNLWQRPIPIMPTQRGTCWVPASPSHQVLYCKPWFGRWDLFGWGASSRHNLPTHSHTPLFLWSWPEWRANMPASWQPWHLRSTTPPFYSSNLLISSKLKTSLSFLFPFIFNLWPKTRGDSSDLCHVFPHHPIDKTESSWWTQGDGEFPQGKIRKQHCKN